MVQKLNLNEFRLLIREIIKEEKNIKWTSDIQNDFNEWKNSDDVVKNNDGTYSTQDAQWKNKLNGLDALKNYYIREYLG